MGIIHLLKKHNMYKLCALIGASAAVANGPGITVSVSQEGINNAKNVAVPYIFNIIKDIKVPEVTFDGGFLKNIAIALPPTGSQSLDLLMLKSTRWASIWKLMFLNKNPLKARMHQNLRFKNLPLPSTQMISISPFQDPSLPRLLPSSSQCSNPPLSHLLLSKFKLKSEPWLTQPSTKTSSSTEVRKLSHILLESPVTTLNMVLVPQ